MANSSASSPWIKPAFPGFYGPVTATLDWCEVSGIHMDRTLSLSHPSLQENYQFSYYIAEMANTFSNLFTIGLAICGGIAASRQALPTRYIAGYAVRSDTSMS